MASANADQPDPCLLVGVTFPDTGSRDPASYGPCAGDAGVPCGDGPTIGAVEVVVQALSSHWRVSSKGSDGDCPRLEHGQLPGRLGDLLPFCATERGRLVGGGSLAVRMQRAARPIGQACR